jgi:redox-sensitive bicupin YhaK (pirin superfamily)
MSRKISRVVTAQVAPLTPTMSVKRVFPNQQLKNIDPFVFLDHFGPAFHQSGASAFEEGTGAHPHRGFITFTYLFEGEMEHKDSRGNRSLVAAGGVQWMKAASGIVHDEKPSKAFLDKGGVIHGLQLWINLPAKHKNDTPQYQPLLNEDVPEIRSSEGNLVRVLIGNYHGQQSPIPTYSPMTVLHVQLAAKNHIELDFTEGWQVAAYLPTGTANLGADFNAVKDSQVAVFEKTGGSVLLQNPNDMPQDIMIYAGQPIGEPIIAYGPFVMDTIAGVQTAYDDFYAGKYGEIA